MSNEYEEGASSDEPETSAGFYDDEGYEEGYEPPYSTSISDFVRTDPISVRAASSVLKQAISILDNLSSDSSLPFPNRLDVDQLKMLLSSLELFFNDDSPVSMASLKGLSHRGYKRGSLIRRWAQDDEDSIYHNIGSNWTLSPTIETHILQEGIPKNAPDPTELQKVLSEKFGAINQDNEQTDDDQSFDMDVLLSLEQINETLSSQSELAQEQHANYREQMRILNAEIKAIPMSPSVKGAN